MAFYKAVNAINHAYSQIDKMKADSFRAKRIPMWRSVSGEIKEVQNHTVLVCPDGMSKLTKKDAKKFAEKLDQLYVGSDHLKAKTDTLWRKIYQVDDRIIRKMDKNGNIEDWKTESIPCHNCGLIATLADIQVDHYMPQVGGAFVTKTFRALGLTTSPPTGAKGSAVVAGNLDALTVNPQGRDQANYDHLADSTAASKWTTNDKGEVLLSLFAYADSLALLDRLCKNSRLNLSPLCRACNGAKSDWVRPIV